LPGRAKLARLFILDKKGVRLIQLLLEALKKHYKPLTILAVSNFKNYKLKEFVTALKNNNYPFFINRRLIVATLKTNNGAG